MIRPITFVTAMLAALSGAYLFGVKHRAQVLDNQLAQVTQDSRMDEQQIRVLRSQWAQDIDPTRLQKLAAAFTDLQPMKPAQLVTLADLRMALPSPGSAAPATNPLAPAPVDIASAPAATPQMTADAASVPPPADGVAALPLPPPAAPASPQVVLASVTSSATGSDLASVGVRPLGALSRHALTRSPKVRHATSAGARLAENLPPPRPLYSPGFAASSPLSSPPIGARFVSASAAPMSDQNGGSMLGMAADMTSSSQGVGN
jgi:hypothetical protein